jgi:hypothetical protein
MAAKMAKTLCGSSIRQFSSFQAHSCDFLSSATEDTKQILSKAIISFPVQCGRSLCEFEMVRYKKY